MRPSRSLRRAGLVVLIAGHAIGAALWAWRAPQGFAFSSPHFFANTALPALLLLGCAAAIVINPASAVLSLAGAWLGGAATAASLFPHSTFRFIVIGGPLGLALFLLAWRDASARAFTIALGLLAGAGWTAAQRAPEASTRPLGGAVGAKEGGGTVPINCGGLSLSVEPVLHFESCADDRFWALWADRQCPPPSAWATQVHREGTVTVIEAQTRFDSPVFSHLNSFTTVQADGTGLLAAFGKGAPVPFTPDDAPLRFAWLGADGVVHVNRGTEDEKGPFLELSREQLLEGALVVVLSDAQGPACRLTFESWAAQASVDPSPTAGWGVAQNDVELLESSAAGQSALFLSLAATSIGRGWDTVGHAAGTYRNVIRFEPLR